MNDIETLIITPKSRYKKSSFQIWRTLFQNIFNSKDLIIQLLKRDLTAQYKKSFLGTSWIFLAPIIGVVSWVFMNSTGLLSPGEMDIPYPAYVLISTSIWGLFMGFYRSASQSLNVGKNLIAQIRFYHEIFFIEKAILQFINFLVVFVINLIVLFFYEISISWWTLSFPLFVMPLFFLGGSIGLLSSMLSIVAQDLSKIIDNLMGLLLFITPVLYSSKFDNPFVQEVIKWNPLTYLIGTMREIIIYGQIENPINFILSVFLSIFIFLMILRIFYLSEKRLIERIL